MRRGRKRCVGVGKTLKESQPVPRWDGVFAGQNLQAHAASAFVVRAGLNCKLRTYTDQFAVALAAVVGGAPWPADPSLFWEPTLEEEAAEVKLLFQEPMEACLHQAIACHGLGCELLSAGQRSLPGRTTGKMLACRRWWSTFGAVLWTCQRGGPKTSDR